MNTLHVKKGDEVKIIAGAHKGVTAKVVRTSPRENLVFVEGVGNIKRRVKPSQLNPNGGTKEIHRGIDASKVVRIEEKQPAKKGKK